MNDHLQETDVGVEGHTNEAAAAAAMILIHGPAGSIQKYYVEYCNTSQHMKMYVCPDDMTAS